MTKLSNSTIEIPSVLAFERKLDPSDATFYAGTWDDRKNNASWPKIKLDHRSLRATISNRLDAKGSDPLKLNQSIENANLQEIDFAALPFESDTLKVTFSLRVLGDVGIPSACNNSDFKDELIKLTSSYISEVGFDELAGRYAYNLANARFLWRNRFGAENIEVRITQLVNGESEENWVFDAYNFSMRSFPNVDKYPAELNSLRKAISSGLSGKSDGDAPYILLKITAFARLGYGQKVFPSEELILDTGSKGMALFRHGDGTGFHSQKIGNAIRTIDTWYDKEQIMPMPIAIETYGSVTSIGTAFRGPKEKLDFYKLFDSWIGDGKTPDINEQHYIMAMLIRGGVFGKSGKKGSEKGVEANPSSENQNSSSTNINLSE